MSLDVVGVERDRGRLQVPGEPLQPFPRVAIQRLVVGRHGQIQRARGHALADARGDFECGLLVAELRGEEIDIIEWWEDPLLFVTNAISPARVQRVSIVDDAEKVIEVVVADNQFSLALGKKGQNVRLAARLTGWKIDLKSEGDKRKEVEAQFGALETGGSTKEAATSETRNVQET